MIDVLNGSLFTLIALQLILSFFLAYSLDFIMQRHGFGIWGTMVVLNVFFPLAYWFSKTSMTGMTTNEHMLFSVAVAFVVLIFMSLFKALWLRV